MHRLILNSWQVWRLASSPDQVNAARDPGNAYLWRGMIGSGWRPRRFAMRFLADAASGQLESEHSPETHPFPHITKWNYTQHAQFTEFYPSQHRSIYLMTCRLQRHPFLALFDGPDTNTSTGARTTSIVSAQALYLMNNDLIKTEAEAFAKQILANHPSGICGSCHVPTGRTAYQTESPH